MFTQAPLKNLKLVRISLLISSMVLMGPRNYTAAQSHWFTADEKTRVEDTARQKKREPSAGMQGMIHAAESSDPDLELLAKNHAGEDGEGDENLLEGFEDQENTASKKDEEELLEGFGEDAGEDSAIVAEPQSYSPRRLDWNGYLRLGSSYTFAHNGSGDHYTYPDWQGLSMLRPEVYLNLDARLCDALSVKFGVSGWYDFAYDIKGMDTFQYTGIDEQTAYETEIEEAYLYAKVNPKIDLKVGRQIVTWGKADFLSVTNIINPMDLRSLGTPGEARLPVGMVRMDFFHNALTVTGISIFEKRFNQIPVYGEEFWPYKYGGIDYDKPGESLENLEYAVAINYRPSAVDLTLYYADIFDNMPYIEPVTDGGLGRIDYKHITHARIKMAGAAFSLPFFNTVILKGEAAYVDGLKYIANPIIPPVSPQLELPIAASDQSYSRVDGLLAFEYTGIKDTIIIAEFLANYRIDYQSMFIDKDGVSQSEEKTGDDIDVGWSAGVNRSFLRNTMNVRLGALAYQQKNADVMIQTLMASYDLTDYLKVTSALLFFDINAESDLIRDNLSDNDRIYLEVKYSF